ncbi:Adenosine deaminase, partial [Stylophora pistillata]
SLALILHFVSLEALDTLHAERIGHGYHVIQDAELYQRIVKEKIHLEVCPTSSILTGAVKPCFKTHPLTRFVEDGVNFSINSDDPLFCQTRVDLEQGIAFDNIGLSPAELTQAVYFVACHLAATPFKFNLSLVDWITHIWNVLEEAL